MTKGILKIDIERCKGCELCISVCPVGILALHKTNTNSKGYHPVSVSDSGKCVGCANCAIICPDGVIKVYKEEEGKDEQQDSHEGQ